MHLWNVFKVFNFLVFKDIYPGRETWLATLKVTNYPSTICCGLFTKSPRPLRIWIHNQLFSLMSYVWLIFSRWWETSYLIRATYKLGKLYEQSTHLSDFTFVRTEFHVVWAFILWIYSYTSTPSAFGQDLMLHHEL